MSVKKMGSKLVQGVRQIKAQQDNPPPAKEAQVAPAVKKARSVHVADKPAPAKASESSTLHPNRVWPD
jgi:hypothetical protein